MNNSTKIRLRPADLLGRSGNPREFELGDEELLNTVADMIVELLEFAQTDSSPVSSAVCEEYPELEHRWGFGTIEALAESMLFAEILPLSKRFTELFAEYNAQRFSGRLPAYEVKIVFDADRAANKPISDETARTGLIEAGKQRLSIRYARHSSMTKTLMQALDHIATAETP
jgi:hypothetical protein